MEGKTIEVYLGNYGAYAAGHLVDRPIGLPARIEDIDRLLDEMQREAERLTGSPCEEFYISDYTENVLAGCDGLFTEHNEIHALNAMAAQLATMGEADIERAQAYIANLDSPEIGYEAAMNVLLQADEVPYYDYGWGEYGGIDPMYQALHDSATPQRRFGEKLVDENPELKELLAGDPMIDSAFDREEYGRQVEMASNVVLLEDGYIDKGQEFDLAYYDASEIEACVMENLAVDPDLQDVYESFAADHEKRAVSEVRRDLIAGGHGYYNPKEQIVVANKNPGAPDGHGAVIGIYSGWAAEPGHVLKLAENGIDIAQYCRDNNLLETIGQDRWDSLAPDMARDGWGWYFSDPEETLKVNGAHAERTKMVAAVAPDAKAPTVGADLASMKTPGEGKVQVLSPDMLPKHLR